MTKPQPRRSLEPSTMVLPVVLGAAALVIFAAEKRRPLRRPSQPEPRRTLRNLTLGALNMAVVAIVERPVVDPLAARAGEKRRGLVQKLPLPAALRDLIAVIAMDYTIFLWHIATHRVPLLWRLHLVHHLDLDLDSTTALRFHFADMAISTPYRAAQILLIGTSKRALAVWQAFFFLSVLFHHSNLRLSQRFERKLALLLATPRMHGIHHSAVRAQSESNWSSGLSLWDRLHGTFRLDVPQSQIPIGVPAYRRPDEIGIEASLSLPFRPHRDAWSVPAPASA